jgi:hypothetical protein
MIAKGAIPWHHCIALFLTRHRLLAQHPNQRQEYGVQYVKIALAAPLAPCPRKALVVGTWVRMVLAVAH